MTTEQQETLQATIDRHNALREQCYNLARANGGALMGNSAWLRNALCEPDMTLEWTPEGIRCSGNTWTSQTVGLEWFEFVIPWSAIEVTQ